MALSLGPAGDDGGVERHGGHKSEWSLVNDDLQNVHNKHVKCWYNRGSRRLVYQSVHQGVPDAVERDDGL